MALAGRYFLYREVFDRIIEKSELTALIQDLDPCKAAIVLCQISAELRLAKRDRETVGKVQQDLAGWLLDDATVERMKERFGTTNTADRPIFHLPQVLNVLRLVLEHASGLRDPITDQEARYTLGAACLMMSDMYLTEEEHVALSLGTNESRMLAIMTQMLGPFEITNSSAITHVIYRARVMFRDLLSQPAVTQRISKECEGFDFEKEFSRIVGLQLSQWLFLLFAFYSYLFHYLSKEGTRCPEFLAIDHQNFCSASSITADAMNAGLKSIAAGFADFKELLTQKRPTDWRFDFVPFKSKPLIELETGKSFCPDVGFLVEKMNSGVYWAINDGLPSGGRERLKLFKAWGILFEEYVNWFLAGYNFRQSLSFWPSPKFPDGSESFDGAFLQDSRFMPMEYKGRFLKIEARYSGSIEAFESDLDLKIGEGCEQLARKIMDLFTADPRKRKRLRDIPLNHVTRVIPVLVVQDNILRGPFVNWWLNKKFDSLIDRTQLHCEVKVDSLNLVNIHELETMAESAEAGSFDIFHGLQLRCHADPGMRSALHDFLLNVPGYGEGKSNRIEKILADQWKEMEEYVFGRERENGS